MPTTRSGHTPRYQPATIEELAHRANDDLGAPDTQNLKNWLRMAEKSRKMAQTYKEVGDYEEAFVGLARAATIVLQKIPRHKEYVEKLSSEQRHNLSVNGQEILDQVGEMKVLLVERWEEWYKNASSSRSSPSEPPNPRSEAREDAHRRRQEEERALEEERIQQAQDTIRAEQEWQRNSAQRTRRPSPQTESSLYPRESYASGSSSRRRDHQNYHNAASEAEERAQEAREAAEHERNARLRREAEAVRYADEAQARREAEAARRAEEEASRRRRQEQEGILRRQQEAEAAARATRRDIVYGRDPISSSNRTEQELYNRRPHGADVYGSSQPAVHMPVATPQPSHPTNSTQNPAFLGPIIESGIPPTMPLESPNHLDDDSSTEAEGGDPKTSWRRHHNGPSNNNTPTKSRPNLIVYPLTTTSPAPPELGQVEYPKLMSQHQLKQGYVPSLTSMFSHMSVNTPTPGSALQFEARPSDSYPSADPHHVQGSISYPGVPIPNSSHSHYSHPASSVGYRGPSPSGARPPPPIPPKHAPPQPPVPAPRIVKGDSKTANVRDLKSIRLPRECLPKFLSIARVNTLQNRETCGLLLGKDKGDKFVVTTLLIPKQHSTSDTCTMDEEELVMQFTEERHLITLGWIHTHPTQSCFMSSVDLHTHSGFQCMLPESFAVVCAPSSTPTFGIFRLTDPEGLQTILNCGAKEAFHPHPEVPIYTDCDNSHVQMKDISLEIVDLR